MVEKVALENWGVKGWNRRSHRKAFKLSICYNAVVIIVFSLNHWEDFKIWSPSYRNLTSAANFILKLTEYTLISSFVMQQSTPALNEPVFAVTVQT